MVTVNDLKKLLKNIASNEEFLIEMKAIFFEAMNAGYVATSKPKKSSLAEIPGYKVITYISGHWKVIDAYQVTPLGNVSGGTTHILYDEIPTWMMHYFGWYREDAVPCLKAALRAKYEEKEFFGGRGPARFRHQEYVYLNRPVLLPFQYFCGSEEVNMGNVTIVGHHSYHGGLMF